MAPPSRRRSLIFQSKYRIENWSSSRRGSLEGIVDLGFQQFLCFQATTTFFQHLFGRKCFTTKTCPFSTCDLDNSTKQTKLNVICRTQNLVFEPFIFSVGVLGSTGFYKEKQSNESIKSFRRKNGDT